MKKSEKSIKTLQTEKENEILRRVLFWLGAAALLEMIVLFINRYYFHYRVPGPEVFFAEKLIGVFTVLQFLGVAVAAVLLGWVFAEKARGGQPGVFRYISAGFFVGISVVSAMVLRTGSACIPILLVGVPALAGLVMIYYLYQREFFVVACASAVGIFGLWLLRRLGEHQMPVFYGYLIAALCLFGALCLLAMGLKKNKGVWKLGGKPVEIFRQDANYRMIFLTCGLMAAAMLGALFLGAAFAYYAMLLLVVWIFVMAVYFTSKLM